jgi:AraC-like DNA-binding protein
VIKFGIKSSTQLQMNKLFEAFLAGHETSEQERSAVTESTWRVSRRRGDFLAGLPVQESESVQTGPGKGMYQSQRICGRDLMLMSYSFVPKMVVHTVPQRDWAILLMSLKPKSDLAFNGRAARPFDLFLSAGRDGYMTTGKDRHNLAIGIRKSRLVSVCAAIAGIMEEDVVLSDGILQRQQVLGQRLHSALIGNTAQPDEEPLAEGQFAMTEALENDLISVLATQLAPTVRRSPAVSVFRVDALRVVRAATAASEELPAPGLADLCAAAGVSQRWLHKCFVDVLGMSPYRYIRLARLSKARDMLLATEDRPLLVKGVALSLGYRLSGRFAADYRSVFGENPTDTLQRSREI